MGSLQLATGDGSTGATCSAAFRNSNYAGVKLSSLTSLSYSTYDQVNNGQQFPYLVLHINYGTGSPSGSADDTLFFEPPYQTALTGNPACPNQSVPAMDTWQTWNALGGCWWSNSTNLGNAGATTPGAPGSGVVPLSYVLAKYPNAYIVNATDTLSGFPSTTQGGIGVEVGETGDPDEFVGNVDNFSIGTATATTTYNFEPNPTTTTVIYDSTTTPTPPNLPSVGFEANQVSELGNQITFSPGTPRLLSQATVTMSSWGCESGGGNDCATTPGATFSEPITLNIYNVNADNSPGSLITTITQTFNIPYRPSADPADCPTAQSEWYSSATNSCYNGLDTNVTFTLPDVAVPPSIIYGIAYNTSDSGAAPYGDSTTCSEAGDCGYDSLNVGLTTANQPSVGTDPIQGTIYWNTSNAGNYCDGGTAGSGTFRLDSPGNVPSDACWSPTNGPAPYYIPAVQFVATTATPVITWANPASITYGTPLSASQLNATASYNSVAVPGTFKYTPALGTVLPAGASQSLSVTFTPSSSNYATVTTTALINVNPAVLTVKATNTSRAFGAANPNLTYTISGYVNGDGSSVVHGSPSCTTTATTTSTGGGYPITCSIGTLSATNYTFNFNPGTLTVSYTTGCLSGTFNGYSVPNNASVCFGSGATVNSYLNVGTGSSLDIEGAKVNGPITSVKSNLVRICGATVTGPVTLSYDTGAIVIGDGASCSANKVESALTLTGDTGSSSVIGATVSGPLTLSGDTGGETLKNNTVSNALTVQNSSGGLTANSNTVSGPFTLESNAGGVTADSNNSTQSFTIQSNTGGITILSNSTKANFTVESNSGPQDVSGNTAKGSTYIH
jgi:hypothetical protein